MVSGRELFQAFLEGRRLARPAFVPLIRGMPARVDGKPLETLTSDPTLWANSLSKTAELFGFDGLVMGFSFSFMAEACGCAVVWEKDRPILKPTLTVLSDTPEETPRMKNALEAAQRVFQVCRTQRACVAAVTGPITLASQIYGREEGPGKLAEAKELLVRVTECFCRLRPDVIIFMEGRPLALAEVGLPHRRLYNTLKNIVSYYNVKAGLYLQGYRPENLGRFKNLKMDLYVLGPSLEGGLPSVEEVWDLGQDALGVGLGLPLDDAIRAGEIIGRGMELYRSSGDRGFFFTSHGPLTRETDMESLHQIVDKIRQARL